MPRFNRRGNTGVFYVPSDGFAVDGTYDDDEISAGQPLHEGLAAWSGFTSEQADLPVPDMGSTWEGTIPGGETPAASSMTFWAGNDDADVEEEIRAALVEGDIGFVVVCKWSKTPTPTDPCDVFPVRVKAVNDQYGVENAGGQFMVGFSIYDPPDKNAAIADGTP